MASTKKSRLARRLIAVATATATALALAACGPDSGGSNGGDAGPQRGGSATIISAGQVLSWDPTVTRPSTVPGVTGDRFVAIYDTLLYVDADDIVQPGTAESFTTDDGGATWTLKLHEGIKFTDGTPYDAEAVKYNWDRAAGEASVQRSLASTFTTEVIDELTLEVTMVGDPDPVLDRLIAESMWAIASPTALEEQGERYTEPVGAGPFMLEKWDQAVGEDMVRNPDYWQEGLPYLDELHFQIIADPAQRVSTVIQGGADLLNNYKFALLGSLDAPNTATTPFLAGGLRTYHFNMSSEPFNDPRAREAAALAMDPTEIVQAMTQDPEEEAWTALFPETSPYYQDDIVIEQNDPARAAELVEELASEGKDLTVRIVMFAIPEATRAAEYMQIALNEVGFNAVIEPVQPSDWGTQVRDRDDFDLTIYPGIMDLNNGPVAFTNFFDPVQVISNFDSPEMFEALSDVRNAADRDELIAAFRVVQEIWAEERPFVVFATDERLFYHRDTLAGLTFMGSGMLYNNYLYRTDIEAAE